MNEGMPFPQYRELLVHINKEHSPNKPVPSGRQVVHIECSTDMRTGTVGWIKMTGRGWVKTITITGTGEGEPFLDRCHRFLDDEDEPVDPGDERKLSALEKLQEVILGELGRQSLEYGEEFGARDLKFVIPTDVLKSAIKEVDDGRGK